MDLFTTIIVAVAMVAIAATSAAILLLCDKLEAARANAQLWRHNASHLAKTIRWTLRHRAVPDLDDEADRILAQLRAEHLSMVRQHRGVGLSAKAG